MSDELNIADLEKLITCPGTYCLNDDDMRQYIKVLKERDELRAELGRLRADKDRLDWVESQSDGNMWVARQSVTGRGFRVHNVWTEALPDTTKPTLSGDIVKPTVREAIDAARAALQEKPCCRVPLDRVGDDPGTL